MIHTADAGFVLEPMAISRSVMRGFLQSMDWSPDDCISLQVGQPEAWERDVSWAVRSCRGLQAKPKDMPVATDTLLFTALLLDVRRAEAGTLKEVLPEWLLATSPLACALLGRAHAREQRPDEAADLMIQALALDKAFGQAHLDLGRIWRDEGRLSQAAAEFNAWIVMRRRIAFDGRADTTDPVVVAQPNPDTDIVFYANRFYIVGRHLDSVGARVIAGELFEIRDNSAFRLARRISRVPALKELLRSVWRGSQRLRNANAARTVQGTHSTSLMLRVRRKLLSLARRFIQRAALNLFAEPIVRRADTLAEAINLANRR